VPKGDDRNVYLVVDDFGRNGRPYREADVETTDLETVIADLLDGHIKTRSGLSIAWPPARRTRTRLSTEAETPGCVLSQAYAQLGRDRGGNRGGHHDTRHCHYLTPLHRAAMLAR
jgi:hypothetical protein